MNFERIILELMERIQVLEAKVEQLEKKELSDGVLESMEERKNALKNISAKYRGLTEYLLQAQTKKVCLSYAEIEEILGFSLPSSAEKHMRSYWANTETHSYASSWLAIGYKARVDVDKKIVIFEKNLY